MADQAGARSSNELKNVATGLLGSVLPKLARLSCPGTQSLKPWVPATGRGHKAKYQSLAPRRAWLADSHHAGRRYERGDEIDLYEETWLGTDGTIYISEQSHIRYNSEPFCSIVHIKHADAPTLERIVSLLERLTVAHFPPEPSPARVECLGEVFTVRRRPDGRALEEQTAMRGGETVDHEPGSGRRPDPWPPDRADQISRLFLSWLYVLRQVHVGNMPFGDGDFGWDMAYSRPEGFLAGAVPLFWLPVNMRHKFAQPEIPDAAAPYVPGGPVSADEVVQSVRHLLKAGHAAWRACELTKGWRDEDTPAWVFVLTDSGVRAAEEADARFKDEARARRLRTVLLNWLGAHACSEDRIYMQYRSHFLATPDAVVDGIAASVIDVNQALGWLVLAGFVGGDSSTYAMPGAPTGVLTQRGQICVEEYEGDPMATPSYQSSGPDQRVFITGSQVGNLATHAMGVSQVAGDVAAQVDVDALRRFAEATAAALPVVGLTPEQQQAAAVITIEIAQTVDHDPPDHPRLRALGRTLRSIVEGASSSALATGLLSIWPG